MISTSRCRSCGFSTVTLDSVRDGGSSASAGCSGLRSSPCRATCRRCGSPRPVPGSSVDAERHHVGAVVLARIPRDRFVRAHRGPDAADLVGRDRRPDAGAVDDDARRPPRRAPRSARPARRCPDSPPHRSSGPEVDRRASPFPRRCATSAFFIATPVWSLPIATRRMSAAGARSAAARHRQVPAGTTVTRRAASVSCASGVTCRPSRAPPSRRRSSVRASASVMMSKRFI